MTRQSGKCYACGRTFDFNKVSRWSAFKHLMICVLTWPHGDRERREGQDV